MSQITRIRKIDYTDNNKSLVGVISVRNLGNQR